MSNVRDGWMATPGRKPSKNKKAGRKPRGRGKSNPDTRLEQPIADSTANVLCEICGHPVDPKRMHPHMIRFHGAGKHPLG